MRRLGDLYCRNPFIGLSTFWRLSIMKISDKEWEYRKTKGTVAFFGLLLIIIIELDIFPL